jgi:hypothetical protein
MVITPETRCTNCGQLLLSAIMTDDTRGVGLKVHGGPDGHLQLIKTETGFLAVCPACTHRNEPTTLNDLLAAGWRPPQ